MTDNNIFEKEEWVRKYARAGIFAKGVVYILIGGLTAMAAINAGGQTSDKESAFQFVLGQPFGKVLLGLIALGLTGYVAWRFIQAVKDPENQGGLKRLGYASSGFFYGLVAFSAVQMILQGGGNSSSSGQQEHLLSLLLNSTAGQIAVGAIALIFFGRALWQLYRALTGRFKKNLSHMDINDKARKALLNFGLIGYISRGIVLGVIGYLFLMAAILRSSEQAGGTMEAFQVLQSSVAGPTLLAVISFGLLAYGVFMIAKAKYRVLPSL
ncbi:MAG: DUF1206 domain-containing protein [Bacteroidales bacterium]